ncbi:MAG: TOMM precursor leader peptide-binding protein [Corynebacteriales bacterium]|nr:TOMM precursor leader peptide-binding protein [Mycobacteriales bacterium]
MRPLLVRSLHRLWRDQSTLQLGLHAPQAVVVTNVNAETRALIGQLNGRHTLAELLAGLRERGQDPATLTNLLALLETAGALHDGEPETDFPASLPSEERRRLAPDLAALSLYRANAAQTLANRAQRSVLVAADGRFGASFATLMAASGIGRVQVWSRSIVTAQDLSPGGLTANDVGRSYVNAAHDAITRAAPHAATHLSGTPDLLVLARPDRPTPAHRWTRRAPHMLINISEGQATIGPLMMSGITACLTCIDRHRSDRDPDWPVIAAQLATEPEHAEAAQLSTVSAAVALATNQALQFIDNGTTTIVGGSLELSDAASGTSHRRWSPHPRCDCGAHQNQQ